MPTTTRESRALLAFTLGATLFIGGLADLASILYGALVSVLRNFVPFDPEVGLGVGISVALGVLSLVVALLGRNAAVAGPQDDVWHHLAVAGAWLGVLLVVMSLLGLLGVLTQSWPAGGFGG